MNNKQEQTDAFSENYSEYIDLVYDCVDRIVVNAYYYPAQTGGGFRLWWRGLHGGEKELDDTHLMRYAGHFSRRVHAFAKKNGIPMIHCGRGERKHEVAEQYIPTDPTRRGVFCILAGLAPGNLRSVKKCRNGQIHIESRISHVNHYYFHIMDPEWGHVTIRFCPHPPFNAQIILNGHEWVAIRAAKLGVHFTKEGNCFTNTSDAAGLARVADTMKASSFVGRLTQVCERWIYSHCLCFALSLDAQYHYEFRYGYSIYQAEYSRNFIFQRGRVMEQVFNGVIDRTRAPLHIDTVKTIFGYKHRPFKINARDNGFRLECAVERPAYDLTVFKVHFGKLTAKIYSKGERVLRVETIAHNTKNLHCGKLINRFGAIAETLKSILERFVQSLHCLDASFIDAGLLENLPLPVRVGATRTGGIDINRPRARAVMESLIALSANPQGYRLLDVAAKVREITGASPQQYTTRQAAYDLKKFRAKDLVRRIPGSRRYEATGIGLRAMAAIIVLRDKVLIPLISNACKPKRGRKPACYNDMDARYEKIQKDMAEVLEIFGIAS